MEAGETTSWPRIEGICSSTISCREKPTPSYLPLPSPSEAARRPPRSFSELGGRVCIEKLVPIYKYRNNAAPVTIGGRPGRGFHYPHYRSHRGTSRSWMAPLCSLGYPMKRSLKGFVFRLFCSVILFTSFAITKISLFAGKSVAKVV